MPDRDTKPVVKPQVNVARSTAVRMWLVSACAGFAVIQSALTDGGVSLGVALTALFCGAFTEMFLTYKTHGFKKIKDGSAVASVMVLVLLLPNQIHPLYAAMGAIFAMAVVKHSFGGLGSNWVNPALGGWLYIRFSWPVAFEKALEGSPAAIFGTFTSGSLRVPLFEMIHSGDGEQFSFAVSPFDTAVRNFLNNTVFPFFNAELPAGYIDLLVWRPPGIIADRGLLALIGGTIIITAFRISRIKVTAAYLAVFGLLVRMAGDLPFGGFWWKGDVLFALLSGGALVAAFILIADPASGAKSVPGCIITAVLGAVFSWMFRYRGLEFYGCLFALALVNALAPVIRSLEGRYLYSRKPVAPAGGR